MRSFHVSETQHGGKKPGAEALDLQLVLQAHERGVLDLDPQDIGLMMQHLVVAEIVQQALRNGAGRAGEEDGAARRARDGLDRLARDEVLQQRRRPLMPLAQPVLPPAPSEHDQEHASADDDDDLGAGENLRSKRRQKGQIDAQEKGAQGEDRQPSALAARLVSSG